MRREDLLHPELVKITKREAIKAYPREALGLVTSRAYVPLVNTASDPESGAECAKDQIAPYMLDGSLVAVFHSHPDGPNCPSRPDMASQLAMEVPFIICATNGTACREPFAWGDMLEPPPMEDRPFQSGVTDCYELMRDHARAQGQAPLPCIPRGWEWWERDQNLYEDGLAAGNGCRVLSPGEVPQVGDYFLAAIRSRVPNHAGVLVEPGLILHHAAGRAPYDQTRIPRREPMHRWRPYITKWVRRDAA